MLYAQIPPGSSFGSLKITIANAVEAPYFILSKTTDAAWNGGIRVNKQICIWHTLQQAQN